MCVCSVHADTYLRTSDHMLYSACNGPPVVVHTLMYNVMLRVPLPLLPLLSVVAYVCTYVCTYFIDHRYSMPSSRSSLLGGTVTLCECIIVVHGSDHCGHVQ